MAYRRTSLPVMFLLPTLICLLADGIMGSIQESLDEQHGVYNAVNPHIKLLEELFDNGSYDTRVRPVKMESTPLNVTMSLVLTDIIAVEENKLQIEMNVWMRLNWVDEFIEWNPSDFGGKDILVIPADTIWLPDIYLYNSVDNEDRIYENPGNIIIKSDGYVHWSKKVMLLFHCQMILTSFPFDEQECYLRFGSWSHDGSMINLDIRAGNGTAAFDTYSEFHENGEWDLLSVDAYRNVTEYELFSNVSKTNETTMTWPEIFFSLKLKRKHTFYFFTLLVPYFIISSLSGLVFVIQPESGEKMGLAITILLALVIFNEYIMDIVPPSADYFPLVSNYFVVMIFWVGLCVPISAWVLHFYHRDHKNCTWMGPSMRFIVFGFMARVICDGSHNRFDTLEPMTDIDDMVCDKVAMNGQSNSSTTSSDRGGILESDVGRIRQLLEGGRDAKKVDELMREAEEAPLQEWREAARIIDRFFFWVYTVVNVLLMISFTMTSIYQRV